jgi:Trk K+ transport system NAD-binding subunit
MPKRGSRPSTATGVRFIEPEGETVVEDGDEVFFLAAREDIRR